MTRRKSTTSTKLQSSTPWSISQLETLVNGILRVSIFFSLASKIAYFFVLVKFIGVKERGLQAFENDVKALQQLSNQFNDESKSTDAVKEMLQQHQKTLSRPDVTPQLLHAALEEHQRLQEGTSTESTLN